MSAPSGVIVLGSTGSIGRQTLEVVRHLAGSHRIVGLAAGWLATRSALRAPILPALRGD